MGNFSTMTEVGRWSLGGPPLCPAFNGADETLVYRTGATGIRKAVYDVSDEALATLTTYTNQAYVQGRMAAVGGTKYYFTGECRSSFPGATYYVNQVNVSTGAIVTKSINTGTTSSYYGQVRISNDTLHVICGADNSIPPHVRVYNESIPITGSSSYTDYAQDFPVYEERVPQWGRVFLNQEPTSFGNGPFLRIAGRRTVGPDVRRIIGSYCYDDFRTIITTQGTWLSTGTMASTDTSLSNQCHYSFYQAGPWHWLEDDDYFYCFFLRNSSTASLRYWAYQRIPKSGWNAVNNFELLTDFGSDYYQVPFNNNVRPRCYDAFAFDGAKTYAYWTVGTYGGRFIHKSLKWPVSTYDRYTVDTSGGEVTGIWTYDPYVYVTKTGGSQGDQLIKFFDSDMIAPPQNLSATALEGQNLIVWDSEPTAVSYNLYWDTSPGVTKATGNKISGINDTFYFHDVPMGTGTVYYVVTTVVSGGAESTESNEDSAEPFYHKSQGKIIW